MFNFNIKKEYLKEEIPARHRNIGLVFITGYLHSRKYGKLAYILRVDDFEFTTLVSDGLVIAVKPSTLLNKIKRKSAKLKEL